MIHSELVIDFIGVCAVFVIVRHEIRKERIGLPDTRLFRTLMMCIMAVFCIDIFSLLLNGSDIYAASTLLFILDSTYYAVQILSCMLWLYFSDYWFFRSVERLKKVKLLYAVPMLAEFCMLILNCFNSKIFSVNSDNVSIRGDFYYYNLIPFYIYIVAELYIVIRGSFIKCSAEQRHRNATISFFILFTVIGVLMKTLFFGIVCTWSFTAMSMLMVYLSVMQQYTAEKQLEHTKMEAELTQSKVSIMLSQIQPHFLYNSLAVINELCDVDPALAKRATSEFAEFLRGNMDSLTLTRPIPFSVELAHTNHYLSLEKLRFQQYLNIEYDITVTDFSLPTLTLQPIVENAVHYGVTKREEGGKVIISTYETETDYVVSVVDNGVGFDISLPHDDGRTHIGISNVRSRLMKMCSGTLDIQSVPNVGTTARITIPKKQTGTVEGLNT